MRKHVHNDPPPGIEGRALRQDPRGRKKEQLYRINTGTLLQGSEQVLSKLYSLKLHDAAVSASNGEEVAIKHRCSCGDADGIRGKGIGRDDARTNHTLNKDVRNKIVSYDSSESDEEEIEDEESVDMQQIISILVKSSLEGNLNKSKATVLQNIVDGKRVGDVPFSSLKQLVKLLSVPDDVTVAVTLCCIQAAAANQSNVQALLQTDIVVLLLKRMSPDSPSFIVQAAARAINSIMKHHCFQDYFLEIMILQGLTRVVDCLSCDGSHDMSPVAELLVTCASYIELAVLILDQCIPQIITVLKNSAECQEPVMQMMIEIASHNDQTLSFLMDQKGFISQLPRLLSAGACAVQACVLVLMRNFLQLDQGVKFSLNPAIQNILLKVMQITNCRRVRKECLACLHELLNKITIAQERDFSQLLVDILIPGHSTLSAGGDAWVSPFHQGPHIAEIHRAGLKELIKVLMKLVCKEAKMSCDASGHVTSMRLRPGMDDCSSINLIIQCFTLVARGKLSGTRVNHHKEKTAGSDPSSADATNVALLVECKSIQLLEILHAFSRAIDPALSSSPSIIQENMETLYLQASLKVWQRSTKSANQTQACDTDHLNVKHGAFLKNALKYFHLLCELSSEDLNKPFRTKVFEEVKDSGDSDVEIVESEEGDRHKYLQSIDQLFHHTERDQSQINQLSQHSLSEFRNPPTAEKTQRVSSIKSFSSLDCARSSKKEILIEDTKAVFQKSRRTIAWEDNNRKENHQKSISFPQNKSSVKSPNNLTTSSRSNEDYSVDFDSYKRSSNRNTKIVDRKHYQQSAKRVPQTENVKNSKDIPQNQTNCNSNTSLKIQNEISLTAKCRTISKKENSVCRVNQSSLQGGCDSIKGAGDDIHGTISKTLRKKLFKGGICESVAPFAVFGSKDLQHLSISILRCMIQPKQPDEIRQYIISQQQEQAVLRKQKKRVCDMAASLAERDKILSQILQQVSTATAAALSDALEETAPIPQKEKSTNRDVRKSDMVSHHPILVTSKPSSYQIMLHVLELFGNHIPRLLITNEGGLSQRVLELVHDLATFGDTLVHMKMTSFGIHSALMAVAKQEVLRQPALAVICVICMQEMLRDIRMQQLFLGEGVQMFIDDIQRVSSCRLLHHHMSKLQQLVNIGFTSVLS